MLALAGVERCGKRRRARAESARGFERRHLSSFLASFEKGEREIFPLVESSIYLSADGRRRGRRGEGGTAHPATGKGTREECREEGGAGGEKERQGFGSLSLLLFFFVEKVERAARRCSSLLSLSLALTPDDAGKKKL